MVPDPHCPACNGTFVEKIENPSDNPRDFHRPHDRSDDDFHPVPESFMTMGEWLRGPSGRGGVTVEINGSRSPGGNTRTFVFGPRSGASAGTDPVPPLSEFIRGGPGNDRIPGSGIAAQQAMINHLIFALAQRHTDRPQGLNPIAELFGTHTPGPEGGRWGDYVYNQEALDQIITQLMENSNAHRPVPATEEIIEKLSKEVLMEKSPFLQMDCAICKDQFKLGTEDPDEQVVITLPCKHPYHQSCILPWLKTNGTCPVCRHQLVPQPGSPETPPAPGGAGGSSSNRRPPPPNSTGSQGGMLNHLFSYLGGGSGSNPSGNNSTGHSRSQSDSQSSSRRGPPGGWSEELD